MLAKCLPYVSTVKIADTQQWTKQINSWKDEKTDKSISYVYCPFLYLLCKHLHWERLPILIGFLSF